ncbi:unnamed protein product [Medioppia subpectinata]|uniref:A-kinase anchor protein 2 C-terminal domain-containing protein n=1 Tax=Medioppia subpectinata TaxID=1979941 RepID=A0A7R9L021_9ACAR|nr:unnamed protein product [Medioppia subpectinata]CAG2113112.1 unnamed protein product [Medioppia subpectinata]
MSSSSLSSFNKISSSSSSASSSVNFPANCRKPSPTTLSPKKVNISMQRFIKSKGLIASKDSSLYSPFASLNGNGFTNKSSDDYYELKPPQFVKKDLTTIKRRVSAICKIQEELKLMKEREEELRWQRVRIVGVSQPNLNTLIDETDETIKVEESQPKDQQLLQRANSNPNLIEKSSEDLAAEEALRVGGPRRRIRMIEMWEKKIQKDVDIKN